MEDNSTHKYCVPSSNVMNPSFHVKLGPLGTHFNTRQLTTAIHRHYQVLHVIFHTKFKWIIHTRNLVKTVKDNRQHNTKINKRRDGETKR